jgi:hypothetical protein
MRTQGGRRGKRPPAAFSVITKKADDDSDDTDDDADTVGRKRAPASPKSPKSPVGAGGFAQFLANRRE